MQLLSELLNLNMRNDYFLVENIGKLKDLGLGRMINAFKQSFSLDGRGTSTRLNIGTKIQSHYTGIGEKSIVSHRGHVRNWPHVRREIIKNIIDPGVAAIMFRIDEKPVALVVLGPHWSINNTKSVVGMAWDFMNVSGSDVEIQSTLSSLSVRRKTAEKDSKKDESAKVPIRMYQGYAQEMTQVIDFIKNGNEAFGNRFDFVFISPEPIGMKKD